MGLNYVLIAGILLYFFMVKIASTSNIKPVTAGAIVVLGYLMLSVIVKAIMFSVYRLSLSQLFTVGALLSTAAQLAVAVYIFYKIGENEDNYTAWLVWSIAGCLLIFFAIPYLVRYI